jgi:hypothetical protein
MSSITNSSSTLRSTFGRRESGPSPSHSALRRILHVVSLATCLYATVLPTEDASALTPVAMPYRARIATSAGVPVEDVVAIEVRLYASTDASAPLLAVEAHDDVTVDAGRLEILVGTGAPIEGTIDAELFAAHPTIALELVIEGVVVGGRQRLGEVPRARRAATVAASKILHGGPFGKIPAAAIPTQVRVVRSMQQDGELVDAATNPELDGWSCIHDLRVVAPLSESASDRHRIDRWFAGVGGRVYTVGANGVLTPPSDPGTITPLPTVDPDEIVVEHVWSECLPGATWWSGCTWTFERIDALVDVTSTCVPPTE